MSINPENVDLVTVNNLDPIVLSLNRFIAHCGSDGKLGKATLQQLVDFTAPYISSLGASAYVNITGTVLPDPVTENNYSIVGAGTYSQTGESDLVLTDDLNIIFWNGTTWTLTKGITLGADFATLADLDLKADISDVFIGGVNLFDPSQVDNTKIISGNVPGPAGEEIDNPSPTVLYLYRFTIPIGTTTLSFKNFDTSGIGGRLGFYDEDGVLIGGTVDDGFSMPYTQTIPIGAVLAKMAVSGYSTVNTDRIQISEGTEPSTFSPYIQKQFNPAYLVSNLNINQFRQAQFPGVSSGVDDLYSFVGKLPFNIDNQLPSGGITTTTTPSGTIAIGSGNNLIANKNLTINRFVNSREYSIELTYIENGASVVSIGMNGDYEIDLKFVNDSGVSNFGKIELLSQKVNSFFISSGTVSVSVGDEVLLRIEHFYDRFYFSFTNKTTGASASGSYIYSTDGTSSLLIPINSKPRLTVWGGSVTLKNFKLSILPYKRPIKTVVFGDSISSCYYCSGYANSYQMKAWAGKESNMATISGPGYTSLNMLEYIQEVYELNPVNCLIYAGANDVLQGRTVDQVKAGLLGLVNGCLGKGIKPYLVNFPYTDSAWDALKGAVLAIGSENNIDVIRFDLSSVSGDISGDGVHLTPQGMQTLADTILNEAPEII